jgi:hypothetical protein
LSKLLKGVSLLALYFLFFVSVAFGTEVVVQDLNQGSCWVSANGNLRVADFNSGKAHLVEQQQVQSVVSHFSGGERPSRLDSMVHCSGGGVALVMNFKVSEKSYCLWMRPTENDFELISLGRSLSDSGPCDGISLAKLTLKQLGTIDSDKVRNYLDHKINEGVVLKYSLSGKWWNVTGSEQFEFKEEDLRDDLMKSGYFESFEFDHLRHHQGEFLKINDLSL